MAQTHLPAHTLMSIFRLPSEAVTWADFSHEPLTDGATWGNSFILVSWSLLGKTEVVITTDFSALLRASNRIIHARKMESSLQMLVILGLPLSTAMCCLRYSRKHSCACGVVVISCLFVYVSLYLEPKPQFN